MLSRAGEFNFRVWTIAVLNVKVLEEVVNVLQILEAE